MSHEPPPPRAIHGSADPVAIARAQLAVLEGGRGRAALATVIATSGSAPQIVGSKLILHDDGTLLGTVGGGAIEAQVIEACRGVLKHGRSKRIVANLVRDLGMCCGGTMEVFVELLERPARLFVIGAGHVAQAIAPVARAAGFAVGIVDDREDLLEAPAFAECRTEACDVDELGSALEDLGDRDFVLIVTRDHARDERALAELLRRPHRYLGMIGSQRKVHTVLRRILAREAALGRPAPDLSRLRAPIGLALGGRTPGEIAVSVVAELIAERRGGSGESMSVVDRALASALKGAESPGRSDHALADEA